MSEFYFWIYNLEHLKPDTFSSFCKTGQVFHDFHHLSETRMNQAPD